VITVWFRESSRRRKGRHR